MNSLFFFMKCCSDALILNVLLHSIVQCYRQCYQRYGVITNRLDVLVKGRWMSLWLQPAVDTNSRVQSSAAQSLWGCKGNPPHQHLTFIYMRGSGSDSSGSRFWCVGTIYSLIIWRACEARALSLKISSCVGELRFSDFMMFWLDVKWPCEPSVLAPDRGVWIQRVFTARQRSDISCRAATYQRGLFHLCEKDPAQHGI